MISSRKGSFICPGQSWLRFDGFIYMIFKKSFSIKNILMQNYNLFFSLLKREKYWSALHKSSW